MYILHEIKNIKNKHCSCIRFFSIDLLKRFDFVRKISDERVRVASEGYTLYYESSFELNVITFTFVKRALSILPKCSMFSETSLKTRLFRILLSHFHHLPLFPGDVRDDDVSEPPHRL
jgi:hypothetical protein